MTRYFQHLGNQIEQAWLERSYDEDSFPRLAQEALDRDPPLGRVKPADIIEWVFSPREAPVQPSHKDLFGEPPVLLFQAPRFYIEALFWFTGTTAIHEHSFSGAFAVLAGSSVHSHWRFLPETVVNSRMIRGRLTRVSTEVLRPGDRRTILSGDRLIHQLFHLEMPSVTIVVRTNYERNRLPQYSYLLPGLAIDREDSEGLRTRRLLLLDAMARKQIGGLEDYAQSLAANGDLETLYHMFSTLERRKVDRNLLKELYGVARGRHGEVVDLFQEVCEGERRTRVITNLRSKITDPDMRFLLALLMLMPDRASILEIIQLQFPDADPLATIEKLLESASGKQTIGFDFNTINRLLFRSLVEGIDLDSMLERVQSELGDNSFPDHRERLREHIKRLAKSDLFHSLFSESPVQERTEAF